MRTLVSVAAAVLTAAALAVAAPLQAQCGSPPPPEPGGETEGHVPGTPCGRVAGSPLETRVEVEQSAGAFVVSLRYRPGAPPRAAPSSC